jgi:cytochrome c biogenesis protein CcmG, thiol:disulfide interchange protein DsbE
MSMRWLLQDARRWWTFSLAILLLGAAWMAYSRVPDSQARSAPAASPREGFPAPDFTLDRLNGGTASLSAQRGQVVVVNLWASWCGPCRAEMPALQKVYAAERGRGLQVLGVNSTSQDTEASARAFVREFHLTFPILLDRDGLVSQRYHLQALPTTFIVDRHGIIRSVIVGGPMTEAFLQSKLESLLQETP